MKYIIIIITIIMMLFITGCTGKVQVNKTDVILAFGDSLTFGYGVEKKNSWPTKLEEITGLKVINDGISGNTTQDGIERIQESIKKHKPNIVIIGLGGNDMLRKVPLEMTIKNLEKMIEISINNNAQVILLPTPKPSVLGMALGLSDAEIYEKLADKYKIKNIKNVYSKWLSKEEYKSDLIHLNEKGYYEVAKEIEKNIKIK